MLIQIFLIFTYLTACLGWNTLYSYTDGKVYLHLKNNDLVTLNFSITGVDLNVELTNNQKVSTITSPPQNSTLFLIIDQLYGITKTSSGAISLIKYNGDKWNSLVLNFTAIGDSSYYSDPTVLTSLDNNNTFYLFGGKSLTGLTSSRMLSVNLALLKVANITTSTTPEPFHGAANLAAPNPQSQLTIGGESNDAWLSMYQLATWDFNAGWSLKQIGGSHNPINSRIFPLALPIFTPLVNSSVETVISQLTVKKVLLLGGELAGADATPSISTLSLESNDWYWNSTFQYQLDIDNILGAATIFNSLVVINGTGSNSKRDITKRDSTYAVSLFDIGTLKSIPKLSSNFAIITPTKSNSSVAKQAILGTVIPICALLIIAAVVFYIMRRRKQKERLQRQQEEMNEIDYQFSSYLPKPYLAPTTVPYLNQNDTSSTLDEASFDSWAKKREEFDRTKIVRDSYLASNDTLHDIDDAETFSDESIRVVPQHSPVQPSLMNQSFSILKKSLSFSNTDYEDLRRGKELPPPPPPRRMSDRSMKTMKTVHAKAENVFADDLGSLREASDSEALLDDKMDVQVLVSSKRRSILRVVNPDLQTIPDGDEDEEDLGKVKYGKYQELARDVGFRQRVPSGKVIDDE